MMLGESFVIGNFGACGATVSLASESPYQKSSAYLSAKDFRPDLAIVMLGTNDANSAFVDSTFMADYVLLLEALKSLPSHPKVWVVRPPHVFDELWLSGRILSLGIIYAVDEVAKQTKLPVIDVYSATDDPNLFFDGVHPNDEGARVIAEVILQKLISQLK
jgi:lysophospholipase L1-like esterase